MHFQITCIYVVYFSVYYKRLKIFEDQHLFFFLSLQIKLNMPKLFLANDILILVVFFFCRVLMIPLSYYMYGRNINVAFLDVPYVIPRMCNYLNVIIFTMQLVWFYMILQAASRVITKFMKKPTTSVTQESNGKVGVEEVNSNHKLVQKVD